MKIEISILADTTDEMVYILNEIKKDISKGIYATHATYYHFDINDEIEKPKRKQSDIDEYILTVE